VINLRGGLQSDYGPNWATLTAAIIERHRPIAQYFYTGIGKKLQRINSDMAKEVMLFFANEGVPVLPSHDSFVMHQGYQEDLQKVMAKAFKDRFGQDVGIKLECKMPYAVGDGELLSMSVEDILSGLEGSCHRRLEGFRV
jgi:hypothetical protein